jgi:hypothetical protein
MLESVVCSSKKISVKTVKERDAGKRPVDAVHSI